MSNCQNWGHQLCSWLHSHCNIGMAASILSCDHSNHHICTAIRDTGLLILLVWLAVFHAQFPSTISSTASWPYMRQNSKYPVVHLTVILLAQNIAGRNSVHIPFGWFEKAERLGWASVISLHGCLITLIEDPEYRVTEFQWIQTILWRRSVNIMSSPYASATCYGGNNTSWQYT